MASVVAPGSNGDAFTANMMSRPQIGIERLQVRRPSNEPKEAMNCKSCRKRKIKCNRLKPTCEACQAFNCACIYDATPKKRGPKTDVLEALLKRVNGLEKRLKDENKPGTADELAIDDSITAIPEAAGPGTEIEKAIPQPAAPHIEPSRNEARNELSLQTGPVRRESFAVITDSHGTNASLTEALIDIYFTRLHGKPYYILDEPATRQRWRDSQLPRYVVNTIHAATIKYANHLCGGHNGAVYSSQEYLAQARAEIDVDEPSIDHLQALLLLTMASFQNGKGKRSYMLLSHAVSMATALSLHSELPSHMRIAPSEREGRRRLFWTCYLMDRFTASGSKRPSSISDECIRLRLPSWLPPGSHISVDGNYFPNSTSLPYAAGVFNAGQGSGAMLVEIVRVLGITNRYLAAGGVKGDSHFPWHAQSTLSKIRSELDYWAASTQEMFGSLEVLFGQPDSSTLVLSKLIYHLIHCLIYRPFLPVDLAELSGTGQHQSWQIEATNFCFLHANAIAELVEIGKNMSIVDWPSFVGYCICTAGTIHVHGAHYMSLREGDLFGNSTEFLSREMQQLGDLRFVWAGIQHQRDTLQVVYGSHSQLVKSLANNPMRYSPVFQMEDFFARYPGVYIDGAHVTFADVMVDTLQAGFSKFNGLQSPNEASSSSFQPMAPTQFAPLAPTQYMTQNTMPPTSRKSKKRRLTTSVMPYPTPSADSSTAGVLERTQSYDAAIANPAQPPQIQSQQHQTQPDFLSAATEPSQTTHDQSQTFTQSVFSPHVQFQPATHGPDHTPRVDSMGHFPNRTRLRPPNPKRFECQRGVCAYGSRQGPFPELTGAVGRE
ncbi:hypothetical protein Q7P37_008974 [Cladosporium fusiforme]